MGFSALLASGDIGHTTCFSLRDMGDGESPQQGSTDTANCGV